MSMPGRSVTATDARTLGWAAFYLSILLAWAALYLMGRGMGLSPLGVPDLHHHAGHGHGFGTVLAMWVLMSVGMMAPTLVPTLRAYDDLVAGGAGSRAGFAGVALGFVGVWAALSVLFAAAQASLAAGGLIGTGGRSLSPAFSALLCLAAGLYQFSPLKDRCASRCRAPTMQFLAHWRTGLVGGAGMGARFAWWCAGCCWAIMALAFVGGTMNLAWMGIATVLMTLEKLPDLGRPTTRPLGLVFLAAAVWYGAGAL